MTATGRQTLVEARESTPEGRLAMAGARAAVGTVTLINQALDASGLSQAELAALLDVTPGRVSQVVNGDGNLRVSTIARFLRAAGYRLKLTAEPAEAGIAPLREPGSRRQKPRPAMRYATIYSVTCVSDGGVGRDHVIQLSNAHPTLILEQSKTFSAVVDFETGKFETPTVSQSGQFVATRPVSVQRV